METTKHRALSGYHYYKSVLNERISKDSYKELKTYADSKGVSLSQFKDFTGNIDDIKVIINKICIVANDFPLILQGKRRIVLSLHFSDSEEFAGTDGHIITLNGIHYDNTSQAKIEYQKMVDRHLFVANTSFDDLIFHELGHAVCNIYNFDPVEIAKKVLNTNSVPEIIMTVSNRLSRYAATTYPSMVGGDEIFDGSEIISESFCGYYSKSQNEFAIAFHKECLALAKEV